MMPMLILASSSPRRQQLLSLLGVAYETRSAAIDERVQPGEAPQDYVSRLSLLKSRAVNPPSGESWIILAADTAVVAENQILGKPADRTQAAAMLRKLRSRTRSVYTALSLRDTRSGTLLTDLCETEVTMRSYHEAEIEEYVASGDPLDKAGAYAIQHTGFNPVEQITGCYTNVVGLPLCHLVDLLDKVAIRHQEYPVRRCRTSKGYDCKMIEKIQEFGSP
ncbi:MAG: septum formation protein Maf [Chloroflexota bacterium]|nr:MAG: septum formation protein Maf [Chloroflexota bacterium]